MNASGEPPQNCPPEFEDYPLTRLEYINVMVHFYRGEVQRSTVLRRRLDATTNWAVLTTAGLALSYKPEFQSGATIVLLSGVVYAVVTACSAWRRRRTT